MASNRPIANPSTLPYESALVWDTKPARNLGSGSEPTTLSTASFNGTGVSNARGTEIRLSRKIPVRCDQYGLAADNSRWKIVKPPYLRVFLSDAAFIVTNPPRPRHRPVLTQFHLRQIL